MSSIERELLHSAAAFDGLEGVVRLRLEGPREARETKALQNLQTFRLRLASRSQSLLQRRLCHREFARHLHLSEVMK